MLFSRRDTLIGAGAAAIAPAFPLQARSGSATESTQAPYPPLMVRVSVEGRSRRLPLRPYLRSVVESAASIPPRAEGAVAILKIYADLLDGRDIDAEDIHLLPGCWFEDLGMTYARRDHRDDVGFRLWVEERVSEVADEPPNLDAHVWRAMTTLHREAKRLGRAGRVEEAYTLCEKLIDIFGLSSPHGGLSRTAQFACLHWYEQWGIAKPYIKLDPCLYRSAAWRCTTAHARELRELVDDHYRHPCEQDQIEA